MAAHDHVKASLYLCVQEMQGHSTQQLKLCNACVCMCVCVGGGWTRLFSAAWSVITKRFSGLVDNFKSLFLQGEVKTFRRRCVIEHCLVLVSPAKFSGEPLEGYIQQVFLGSFRTKLVFNVLAPFFVCICLE